MNYLSSIIWFVGGLLLFICAGIYFYRHDYLLGISYSISSFIWITCFVFDFKRVKKLN